MVFDIQHVSAKTEVLGSAMNFFHCEREEILAVDYHSDLESGIANVFKKSGLPNVRDAITKDRNAAISRKPWEKQQGDRVARLNRM